jgi:hypothetical protein
MSAFDAAAGGVTLSSSAWLDLREASPFFYSLSKTAQGGPISRATSTR